MWRRLRIRSCPVEVLRALADASSSPMVTVESLAVGSYLYWQQVELALAPGERARAQQVRNLRVDLQLTRAEFIEQMPLWDRVGVHAIFSERPLPKRVCDLPEGSREAILERFGLELEIAMGDATCDGFTELATPHPHLIERAEQALEALGQRALIEWVQG